MSTFNFSEIESLKGYSVEWDSKDKLILAKGNNLYEIEKGDSKEINKIGEFPLPSWKKFLIRFLTFQRLLRGFFYNVVVLKNNDIFVTFGKSLGVIKQNGEFIHLEGMDRPFRVLRNAIAEDLDGSLYFGEYSSNTSRDIMRIYKYCPGDSAIKIVYTFKKGEIRHIHGVYFDKYSNSIWCVTGDVGSECKFIQTFDGFKTISVIGSGDETWRAVSLLFSEDNIFYAMDAEFQENKIFLLSRQDMNRIEIGKMDGPVYYSVKREGGYFFQVTAELCPSQKDKNASIWHSNGKQLNKIWFKEKDKYPKFMMPGTVNFPNGEGNSNEIYFHCVGVSGCSSKTFKLSINSG